MKEITEEILKIQEGYEEEFLGKIIRKEENIRIIKGIFRKN